MSDELKQWAIETAEMISSAADDKCSPTRVLLIALWGIYRPKHLREDFKRFLDGVNTIRERKGLMTYPDDEIIGETDG